ncbi:MAG: hypothetical protein ABW101_14170 [Candidatus Thiodiazotropha sp.]
MLNLITLKQRLTDGLIFLFILLLGLTILIGSGGGGGGSTTSDASDDSELLSYYNLRVTGVDDPLDDWSAGLNVRLTQDGMSYQLRVDPQSLEAGYLCDPTTRQCRLDRIDTATRIEVYDLDEPDSLFGDFRLQVLDEWIIDESGLAVSGALQLAQASGFGFIELAVNQCDEGWGVNITDNGALLGCYTWNQLEGLLRQSSVDVERLADLAYGILDELFDLIDSQVLGSFELLDDHLETVGNISLACDRFSDVGLSPPPPYEAWDQGERIFHWVDDTGEWDLGAGDSFGYLINRCWRNDPQSLVDILTNGTVDLIAFTELVDGADWLQRIGFEGTTNARVGGVFFDYFVWIETLTDEMLNRTSVDTEQVINGGISVVFFAP